MPLHTKKMTPDAIRRRSEIGSKLLMERIKRDLDQRDFAVLADTAQQTISKYERGVTPDSWLFLGNLHLELGIDLNKLLSRTLTREEMAELKRRYRDLESL